MFLLQEPELSSILVHIATEVPGIVLRGKLSEHVVKGLVALACMVDPTKNPSKLTSYRSGYKNPPKLTNCRSGYDLVSMVCLSDFSRRLSARRALTRSTDLSLRQGINNPAIFTHQDGMNCPDSEPIMKDMVSFQQKPMPPQYNRNRS